MPDPGTGNIFAPRTGPTMRPAAHDGPTMRPAEGEPAAATPVTDPYPAAYEVAY